MRLRKTLAYGDGESVKPQKIRKLAYTLALSLPLIAACAGHAVQARGTAPAEPARAAQKAPQQRPRGPACASGIESLLQPGETVVEAVCRFGRDYVMTNTSLLIVTRPAPSMTFEPIVLSLHATRTDMGPMRSQGIADWEPSEDSVFILTKSDRTLTRLPNEGMDATVPAFVMPFDTMMLGRESMVYYSGFLFIAPRGGDVTVFSFGDRIRSGTIPLRSRQRDAGFFMKGNRLIFGKAGVEETEIMVDDPDTEINDIRLKKRI